MYHHEPTYDDEKIAAVLAETRRLEEITRGEHVVQVSSAWDGMELDPRCPMTTAAGAR